MTMIRTGNEYRRRLLAFAHLGAVYRNFGWDGPLDFVKAHAALKAAAE
jgi:hypothetical protein